MTKIHFILTGGTIDSVYDGIRDTAVTREHSVIPKYLEFLNLYDEFVFSEVCMKDSRNLDEDDRKRILEILETSEETKYIITHGTYTMPDTARWLEAKITKKNIAVIVTGSMIPLEWFLPSDGPYNLWYAISEIKHLENGIFVSMNWRLLEQKEVIKELNTGKFTSIL
jgi:L-asparaginase